MFSHIDLDLIHLFPAKLLIERQGIAIRLDVGLGIVPIGSVEAMADKHGADPFALVLW